VPWKYDPGERRRKHKWDQDYAGFQVESNLRVGKCPVSITPDLAHELLNSGIPWTNPYLQRTYPHNIYNVHNGVIYKAVVTVHGVSYHGYPCEGRLPREVVTRLRDVAAQKGCSVEFEEWLKQYITP
jgi:hypothetical protein